MNLQYGIILIILYVVGSCCAYWLGYDHARHEAKNGTLK